MVKFKVFILQSAEQDLRELKEYLCDKFSAQTWRESYRALQQNIRHIQTFPLRGRVPEELAKLHLKQYRQVLCGLNRIIYEVDSGTQSIYIHMLIDSRRDMQSVLMRRLLSQY